MQKRPFQQLKQHSMLNKEDITSWLKGLQTDICDQLSIADGSGDSFRSDLWERPGGGGGLSRILEGKIIEKGGVGFSEVHGNLSEGAQKNLGVNHAEFPAVQFFHVPIPESHQLQLMSLVDAR